MGIVAVCIVTVSTLSLSLCYLANVNTREWCVVWSWCASVLVRVHACECPCVRACARACLRACVCVCVRVRVRVSARVCERECVCSCVRACVRAFVRSCVRACVRGECLRVYEIDPELYHYRKAVYTCTAHKQNERLALCTQHQKIMYVSSADASTLTPDAWDRATPPCQANTVHFNYYR